MDFRPLPEDREEQFRDYVHYAFRLQDGPVDEHEGDLEDDLGDPRGLFDGDAMVSVCRHHWFRARLRDRWFEMPGLAAVATPPEHRRKGYVTQLLAESLAEYRERGDFLTALWAFKHPFYGRHGWGLANRYVRYECDPGALAFSRSNTHGGPDDWRFRRIESDEYELLEPVLVADAEDYELEMNRTEEWWHKRVFDGWRGEPYVYGWEKDGQMRGYVVYRVSDEDDGKQLHASELAAVDHEARLHLLRLLANHDSQVERVTFYGPDDASLLDLADDPAEIECEVKPGPMVRLVDVPTALEALDYPDAPDGELTLAVDDSLVDWNDGAFRVTVEDGRATCEPTDADSEVRTGVATLSQVYVGYHSVADAETFGDLEVEDGAAREVLSAMFPPRDVFLREGF